jgi:hypothetical protein
MCDSFCCHRNRYRQVCDPAIHRTTPKNITEMAASTDNINDILNNLPHLRRGTGGVAAVVQDGKVLGKKA